MKNITKTYQNLLDSIGNLLQESRRKAYHQINIILIKTYWEIGRHIVVYEQKNHERAAYGSHLLDRLSKDLKTLHGKGFSRRNVLNMRSFYLAYPKWQAVPAILSWTHIVLLLSIADNMVRSFYERECVASRWSTRELERQINSMLFERLSLSKDKKGILKLGTINHQDIGQMNLYLNYFKKEEMAENDNEPVGIILGAQKDHVLVEYALGGISNKLFASKYCLSLPDKHLLQKVMKRIIIKEKRFFKKGN